MGFVFEEIPPYLSVYIVEQRPDLYTPIDHASWRFILKLAKDFFRTRAHQTYLAGLEETGISSDRIPLISEMDAKLRKFGWRAVAVSGFIPPRAFMEFLSIGVMPIACDMRTIEHLAYTPAPDIVHEAAGHAPILGDKEFAEYLRSYGELARRAIYSSKDIDVYNAIRSLSDLKEDPKSTPAEILASEKSLESAIAAVDFVSEGTQLSRMGWWTFEYGLVGDLADPKIYGAGLLSSVGESFRCLGPEVKKIPFSLECIETNFDITRPQPQLFVAQNFQILKNSLEELANQMAFRRGGVEGLLKARDSQIPTTAVLDSGVQISGTLEDFKKDSNGNVCFLKFKGPCQISVHDKEISNQSVNEHPLGFSSPLGLLKSGKNCTSLDENDLMALGFKGASEGRLEFASGITLSGVLFDRVHSGPTNYILRFKKCKVALGTELLFDPSWGIFDLACGTQIPSVFGGAADREAYMRGVGGFNQAPQKPKSTLTKENKGLNDLYARIRKLRDSKSATPTELRNIRLEAKTKFPSDWLLSLEILELTLEGLSQDAEANSLQSDLVDELRKLSTESEQGELIDRGLKSLHL